MGAAGGATRPRITGAAGVLVLLVLLVLLVAGGGSARAAGCDTSWTAAGSGDWSDASNWSNGVPTAGLNACITLDGTYTVNIAGQAAQAASLQLGGSNGTQTLLISGGQGVGAQASLSLGAGGSVGANGVIDLTDSCSTSGCTPDPAASLINQAGGTPLVNAGTISALSGSDQGANDRELAGDITNTGTIALGAQLTYAVGTLANQGNIDLNNQTLTLLFDPLTSPAPAVENDTGGVITNAGGSGELLVPTSGTFTEAGGTVSPASSNPAHPAVVIDDSSSTDPLPSLVYTGTGASTIVARGSVDLSGNIAAAQNLIVDGAPTSSCPFALTTAAGSFTNAGTIDLAGSCGSGLAVSGTLTNTGRLIAEAAPSGVTREIKGSLANSGTVQINGPTAFDKGGATLVQSAGSTTLAPGAILDTSSSGATFQLQGGVLSGGGHSQSTAAIVNGPVANTGGDVIPGSTMAPGLMSVNGYSQGAGGRLTEVIDGTSVGSEYSQLSSLAGASVGGTLALTTLSGPSVGHLYTVVGTNGTRSGRFSKLLGQFRPEGSFPPGWSVGYKPDYQFSNAVALDAAAASGLRVKKAGQGSGSVTSSPSGISCSGQCDAPFFHTQTVILTAHPRSGSKFLRWSGACSGSGRTCRVKMNRARTVTARFGRS